MICVTGNTHGHLRRFKHPVLKKLRKGDTLIICGDFGFLWNGGAAERRALKWIGRRPYHVLFVDGCHENFSLLAQYETQPWKGGMTRPISGHLRQLLRGEVYEIDGKRIFAFGGGHSEDMEFRTPGESWWREEVPTEAECANGLENIERADGYVDYVVTHEPPESIHEMLDMDGESNSLTCEYLSKVSRNLRFKSWFFGKRHINKRLSPQYCAVFDQVIVADPARYKRDKHGEIKVK